MVRAQVFDVDLQRQLMEHMAPLKPLPSIYFPDFIAANQSDRADNVLTGTKLEQMETIRSNIRDFKAANGVDKVIVLWSANTERFSDILPGVNDTAEVMKELMHRLLMMRVRPYYIYQCDLVKGTHHLRSSVRKGIEIMEALRGHTTGYAVPEFVIDAPGGGGKVPVGPQYVLAHDKQRVIIRNYEGQVFEYPELPDGMGVPPARCGTNDERC